MGVALEKKIAHFGDKVSELEGHKGRKRPKKAANSAASSDKTRALKHLAPQLSRRRGPREHFKTDFSKIG